MNITKRGKKFLSIALVILLMVNLLAIPTFAWSDAGWKLTKKLVLSPHESIGSTSLSHFNEAFWGWNSRSSVYNLQRSLTTHTATNFYSATQAENRIYKVYNSNDSAPAVARTSYDSNKKVISAAINLNPARPLGNGTKNAYDVWTIFIHEAGHILGFNHTSIIEPSVMNVLPMGSINRSLTSNDIIGVNSKYK